MKFLIYFITVVFLAATASSQGVNLKQVRCLVCRTIVDEYKHEVDKIDPKKQIEIGQYRLDSKGNTIQKKVPLSKSEIHLSEMLDSICKRMEDYVRATYKSNGKLLLFKLMANGGLNPLINEVNIVQDGDLNKSLEYFCTEVVNDNEEAFIDMINKKTKNAKSEICTKIAGYCDGFFEEDENEDDSVSESTEADKDEL